METSPEPSSDSRRLKIAVCIKQVPKGEHLEIDPVRKTLVREGVESEMNPADRNAVEMALQLRDKHGGEIIALSMGPSTFLGSLEMAVGMGVDRAVLLSDRALAGSDTTPTSYALAETVTKFGKSDLILCGEETSDSSTGHVGPGMAGHLDIPQITYVVDAKVMNGKVVAKRAVEFGFEIWETKMPALLTVKFGCNRPREPTLSRKIKAKRGNVIQTWSATVAGLDVSLLGLEASPTWVSKIETVELPSRMGETFSDSAKDNVSKLLGRLKEDGFIRGL
ncbi:MAG: electron transfer flavoprotein subunit beta/FixA family protein [Methanobacteriota archaeon]|nr:MAG: electron transfer flavoprotein subunit beta/FixA family protein [Euryarchaeota archaeon]